MIELREALLELFPRDEHDDWDNVMQRAGRPRRSARRFMLALAAVALLTLAVGSALALSGKLGNLFHGTPVKDLSPRERFFLSESDMSGKVELIAKRNGDAFYVIQKSDGTRCFFIGDARRNLTPAQREGRVRFGGGGCIDPRIFPSRAVPVLDFSYYSYHAGDPESRLAGLQGFATDPVDRIGVIGRDNQIIFTTKVERNVYTTGKRGFMGARGIVALDEHGKVLWVQCTAMGQRSPAPQFPSGGCGKYKTTPPPKLPPRKLPRRPIEAPGPLVVQHGAGDGASVDIRGSRITVNFSNLSPEERALLASKNGKIGFGCFKLVKIGGGQTETSGAYSTKPFTDILRLRPYDPLARTPRPPYDACTAMGQYGHTWNDAHGTHDTIEIALTQRGRFYLAERAVERDIEWLARSRVFRDVRYALRPFTSESAASRLGSHVVPLRTAGATPPAGKLGIWIGPERRIILAERTPNGRRLYLELRHGIIYRTSLY